MPMRLNPIERSSWRNCCVAFPSAVRMFSAVRQRWRIFASALWYIASRSSLLH